MTTNRVHVKLDGLDEIHAKIDELYAKIRETSKAADELFEKTVSVEVEINQPSAGTGD